MRILKVISLLMEYPGEELRAHAEEIAAEINGAREIPSESRACLLKLLRKLTTGELMDVQEEYGFLFDRGRSLSLLLFEHVHGESRDRGQAMVNLLDVYQRNGFEIGVRELPDYIPLYLEFLSQQPELDAREGLADVAHILGLLSARLQERRSEYYALFDALLIISGAQVDIAALKATAAREERDDTPEALDKVWEEEQVTFMDNQQPSGCSSGTYRPPEPAADQATPIHFVSNNSQAATRPR